MSLASFEWFWQPPMTGEPGILMIVDTHPGPQAPDVPFVAEDLKAILEGIETRIPDDVHLHQLRIYARDIFKLWIQLEFNILGRQFTKTAPDFSQEDLERVWENHVVEAGFA
jgi:hypothetical protein